MDLQLLSGSLYKSSELELASAGFTCLYMGLFASCHQNLLNSRLGHSFCLFVCVLNLSSRQFRPNGTRAMNLLTWLLSWASGIQIKLVSLKAKRAVISWTGKALNYLEEQIDMSIM